MQKLSSTSPNKELRAAAGAERGDAELCWFSAALSKHSTGSPVPGDMEKEKGEFQWSCPGHAGLTPAF